MRLTRHQHHNQILFDCSLHNQTLENIQFAKCLGIAIVDNMNWGHHISEISSKATKTLGFLYRNLAFAHKVLRNSHVYKTLVHSKLNMQHPFGALTLNIRLRKFRGQLPAGPAEDVETQVVSVKCLMSLSGHLFRPIRVN